jgi:hypothetical protein
VWRDSDGRPLRVGSPGSPRPLNRVTLRDDAPALRCIATAQLGDLVRAKSELKKAARSVQERR